MIDIPAMIGGVSLFLLGVVMLMLTRWQTGPAPGARSSAWTTAVRTFACIFIFVGFASLPTLFFAIVAVIIAMAYSKQAATQQCAMLALLGAAAERSMPLETAFAAFGNERGGWMRRRTAEIAHLLQQGKTLPAALKAVPGVLPPEAVPLVCVGYENGSLGPAVAQAIAARNLYEPVWQSIVPKAGYICLFPVMAMPIALFVAFAIMPQFKRIFQDFGMKLPDVTIAVFFLGRNAFFWLAFGALWLLSGALLLYGALRYAGSIRWDLPGMGWLMRRRHSATVLDALALAAQRQRPLSEALSTLALSYPRRPIARRLRDVYLEVQAGGDDLKCLHAHGLLGKTDLALLQSAQRNGNLAWAAGEMADSNRRRFIYRTYAVIQVLFPMVVVGYGLLVAAFAVAVFLPLIQLIQRLVPA